MELIKQLKSVQQVYHFCLPFYEDNTTSIFQPQWKMWDEAERDKWVQEMPRDAISLADLDESMMELYQSANLNPDKFLRNFAFWYANYHKGEPVACGIGIRTQESLHRYRAILNRNFNYQGHCWIKHQTNQGTIVNFYPLYDWKTEDVWGAYAHFDWEMNAFITSFIRRGLYHANADLSAIWPATTQRTFSICVSRTGYLGESRQPRLGRKFWPLVCTDFLVGPLQYSKTCPHDLAGVRCLLLESIGLYSKNLQDHYYRKISILIAHYRDKYGVHVEAIPDETKRKRMVEE